MSTSQLKGQGTSIAMTTTTLSPAAYTLGEVMNISGPNQSNPTIDSTDMSETAKSFISAGVVDNGEVSLTIGYRPALASHAALKTVLESGEQCTFVITLTDSPASTITFPGVVTGLGREIPKEALVSADATIKVVGAVT